MIPSLPIGGATAPADGKEPEDIPAIRLLVKQRPDVLALAEVVSPAVYVEPALLRTARYRLLPHLGAEAEAGLWFGPLTTPTRSGLVFMASALPSLRRRLAADPERFEAAADLVQRDTRGCGAQRSSRRGDYPAEPVRQSRQRSWRSV